MKAAVLFVAIMEILKIHVVAFYFFNATGRPLPFVPSALGLLASLALNRRLRQRGGRVAAVWLSNALGLGLFFYALYTAYRGGSVFAGGLIPKDPRGAMGFSLTAFAVIAFWARGAAIEKKTLDHARCVQLFDAGLGLFFAAFCLAALVRFENAFPLRLVFPYFLFSILALGLSRSETARRGGLDRHASRAMLLPTAIAFAVAAAGVVALVPVMFAPAAFAGQQLKNAYEGFEPYLEAFLRWLFSMHREAPAAAVSNFGDGKPPVPQVSEESPWEKALGTMLAWVSIAVIGALVLVLVAYGMAKLFRYLASRVEGRGAGSKASFPPAWLRAFILAAARFFGRLEAAVARLREKRSAAVAAYAKLLACGRAAGFARRAAETPREYARRLESALPRAAREAPFVAEALERELYGKRTLDAATERKLDAVRRGSISAAFIAERARRAFRKKATSGR